MSAIEAYRRGYEAGVEERNSGIIQSLASNLAGLASLGLGWTEHLNETYSKGYQDGLNGNDFDPPDDD